MSKRAKIIKFVKTNKKQIMFALFAIYCIFDKSEIYKSIAPVVIAEGVKAAKTGVDAVKLAKEAKAAGDTAKMVKEGARAAHEFNTARETAKAAKEEIDNSEGGQKAKNIAYTAGGLAMGAKDIGSIGKNNTNKPIVGAPKNLNPNPNSKIENNFDSLDKNNSKIDAKSLLPSLFKNSTHDDDVELESMGDKDVEKNVNPIFRIIIIFGIVLSLIMSVPLLIISGGIPTTNIMKGLTCDISTDADCKKDTSASFLERLKNLLKYGSFASNNELMINKIESIYKNIYETYEVKINIPILISSLTADLTTEELIRTNSSGISEEILERLKYAEDLAMMQFKISDQNYQCKQKEEAEGEEETNLSDGEYYSRKVSDLELIAMGIDPNSIEFHICDEKYVDEYMKIIDVVYDVGQYLDILKESIILKAMYPEYDNDRDKIIEKIEQQNDLYEMMYGTGAKDQGTIPLTLFHDEKLNLKSPLNGKITITSPFGEREGVFSGFHKGVDVVSNDKNIYSCGNGVVTRANFERLGGNVVEITHTDSDGNRYISQYGHLNQILVSVGQNVSTGDVIGIMGATGLVTGPHLHFQMWQVSPYELYNPRNLFAEATNY